jgi:hypothetical protein
VRSNPNPQPVSIFRLIPIRLALGTIVNVHGKRYTVVKVSKRAKTYKHTLEVAS